MEQLFAPDWISVKGSLGQAAVSHVIEPVLAPVDNHQRNERTRDLYGSLYYREFRAGARAMHHLLPLYLGGGHQPHNLLDLGNALQGRYTHSSVG